MSNPRRTTYKPASRYRGEGLVRGLVIAVGVLLVGYGVVGFLLADYLARGGAR